MPFFYGWWIVLAGGILNFLHAGFWFYGFSTLFLPLGQEFGWSRTALSATMSFARMETGLLGPIDGFLVDRLGPRKIVFVGIAIMGAGFVFLTQVSSLLLFYLVYLFLTLGAGFASTSTVFTAVGNWFVRKRGKALGLASMGVGLGGGILVPFMAFLISSLGWRAALMVVGVLVWGVGLPLSLVLRHKPESYGLLPDGGPSQEKREQSSRRDRSPEVDFTPGQALRAPAFWLLALANGLRILVSSAIALHAIPLLVEKGFSPQLAATLLGMLAMLSAVGRVGYGWFSDYTDRRFVYAGGLFLMAIGLLILLNARSVPLVILFLVLYAPAYGGLTITAHALRGEYFGRRSFGTILGLAGLIQMVGTVGGPVVAGYVYDVTLSYQTAILIFIGICLIAMVLILSARRPALKPAISPS